MQPGWIGNRVPLTKTSPNLPLNLRQSVPIHRYAFTTSSPISWSVQHENSRYGVVRQAHIQFVSVKQFLYCRLNSVRVETIQSI